MSAEPHRTCLVCRRVRPKSRLLRLVRGAGGLVRLDPTGGAAGRGAYICAESRCIDGAAVPARLRHAFKQPCEPAPGLLPAVRSAVATGPAAPSRRHDADLARRRYEAGDLRDRHQAAVYI